jgi:hypothetical protein
VKTPHKFPSKLILILAVLVFALSGTDLIAQVPCQTPTAQGQASTWRQNATVNVMIDPTFSPAQQQAIRDQWNNWSDAGSANITFNFVEPSQAGPGAAAGGVPIISVMHQIPANLGATAQGETRGFSYNGYRGDSFMDINPGVTRSHCFCSSDVSRDRTLIWLGGLYRLCPGEFSHDSTKFVQPERNGRP